MQKQAKAGFYIQFAGLNHIRLIYPLKYLLFLYVQTTFGNIMGFVQETLEQTIHSSVALTND